MFAFAYGTGFRDCDVAAPWAAEPETARHVNRRNDNQRRLTSRCNSRRQ